MEPMITLRLDARQLCDPEVGDAFRTLLAAVQAMELRLNKQFEEQQAEFRKQMGSKKNPPFGGPFGLGG